MFTFDGPVDFSKRFPDKFFDGGNSFKQELIAKAITNGDALKCFNKFIELTDSLPFNESVRSGSVRVLKALFQCNPQWFVIPTSTSGKYHGGRRGAQNSVGGIYEHIRACLIVAESVIGRYKDMFVERSLDSYIEDLSVACLLHDIGKLNFDPSLCYSIPTHGEAAVEFIQTLGVAFNECVLYAIANHMYGWKVAEVFNQVKNNGVDDLLLMLCMLCECDYFSTHLLTK